MKKSEWRRRAEEAEWAITEIGRVANDLQRRLHWLRTQVTQWRDNEDTKSLPPMRRDEAIAQIRKSEIRRDAYDQVLQMMDNPVPYHFGRAETEDEA